MLSMFVRPHKEKVLVKDVQCVRFQRKPHRALLPFAHCGNRGRPSQLCPDAKPWTYFVSATRKSNHSTTASSLSASVRWRSNPEVVRLPQRSQRITPDQPVRYELHQLTSDILCRRVSELHTVCSEEGAIKNHNKLSQTHCVVDVFGLNDNNYCSDPSRSSVQDLEGSVGRNSI